MSGTQRAPRAHLKRNIKIILLTIVAFGFTPSLYAKPAQRIISLAPNVTEMLYAIGAGPQVVGVSIDSNYPKAAQNLPQVGGFEHINTEEILSLHPDLVVAWRHDVPAAQLQMLKRFGIKVVRLSAPRIHDIPNAMMRLGFLSGHSAGAEQQAEKFDRVYKTLKAQGQKSKPKRVLIVFASHPLYVAGSKSLQSQIIHLCGGKNIFSDIHLSAAEVSEETVIVRNPQVIITLAPASTQLWKAWPQLAAIKHHAVYLINGDLLARPGPRLMQGAEEVCSRL